MACRGCKAEWLKEEIWNLNDIDMACCENIAYGKQTITGNGVTTNFQVVHNANFPSGYVILIQFSDTNDDNLVKYAIAYDTPNDFNITFTDAPVGAVTLFYLLLKV